ncbi:calpain-10 isoform X3 [Paramormyrops kingsleyae]|nr:calpain-10 isoform X3 [Paramormyrops kingsleyae]
MLRDYIPQRITGYCNINAVIFFTNNKKRVCANPKDKWVQKAMSIIENAGDGDKLSCIGGFLLVPMEPSGSLFIDPDFAPADCSLFSDCSTPIARLQGAVEWMRPQEICSSPKLFPENPKEGHPKQGILGDCWFLCACTALLKNKHLMDKVFPPGQPQWGDRSYKGKFRFRFWRFGRWVDVRVDDCLPCLSSRLCFSHCQSPSVFWVPLLEKAYAKLRGSYERLWAGQVAEALVDLTGGLAEQWSLKDSGNEEDPLGQTDKGRRRLDLDSLQAVKGLCSISGSVHSAPGGASELGQHHALSVMEWIDLPVASGAAVRLLRVRNPWGRPTWGGAWREGGERWEQMDQTCALDLLSRTEEGEFWMEEAEFLEEFDEVTVGYPIGSQGFILSIYTGCELPHSYQIGSCWIKGHSSGGCRNNSSFGSNPKFWLQMKDPGEVLVSLLQHRLWRNSADSKGCIDSVGPQGGSRGPDFQHHAIGLHIWKVLFTYHKYRRTYTYLGTKQVISVLTWLIRSFLLYNIFLKPRPEMTLLLIHDCGNGVCVRVSSFQVEKKHFNLVRTLNKPASVSTHCHAYQREVSVYAGLSAGAYLVVPSTFLPGAEASFLLRVFSSAALVLSLVEAPGVPPLAVPDGEWEIHSSQGSWVPGQSAGGSRNFPSHWTNPHVLLLVSLQCEEPNVRVSLRQHGPPSAFLPIGFHIYQVPDGFVEPRITQGQEPQASCVPHCYTQEVSLQCSLPPGAYAVVPSTYQPDSEGNFTLTVSRKILRKVVMSQESLGNVVRETSYISVMRS